MAKTGGRSGLGGTPGRGINVIGERKRECGRKSGWRDRPGSGRAIEALVRRFALILSNWGF